MLGSRWTAVPVVRDALVATVDSEAAGLAGNCEERLERLTVESSAGRFGTVVGHEVDHEVVRSRRNQSREGSREIVGVVEDRPPGVVVGVGSCFRKPIGFPDCDEG